MIEMIEGAEGPCKASMLVPLDLSMRLIEASSGRRGLSQFRITSTMDAFGTPWIRSSVSTANIISSMIRPSLSRKWVYPQRPGANLDTSCVDTEDSHSRTPLPSNVKKPMWDTSNRPAFVRHARCSERIEEYCMGSSKP